MKVLTIHLLIALTLTGSALSQNRTIAEHPFFASMLEGSWTEAGEMVQPQGAVAGKSTSKTKAVLNGQWLQQDGTAEFGSSTWEWRWMFRLATTNEGKEVVQARYLDTNGQIGDYIGEIVNEGTVLRLSRPLSDTVRNVVQVTNREDGSRLVEVALIDKSDQVSLQYKAVGKKDS